MEQKSVENFSFDDHCQNELRCNVDFFFLLLLFSPRKIDFSFFRSKRQLTSEGKRKHCTRFLGDYQVQQ